jgi:hypothetical protein
MYVLRLYVLFRRNIEVKKVETIKVTNHCTCQKIVPKYDIGRGFDVCVCVHRLF